jgi:hypothetical protein
MVNIYHVYIQYIITQETAKDLTEGKNKNKCIYIQKMKYIYIYIYTS